MSGPVLTLAAFKAWFEAAPSGEAITYHEGLLGFDRTCGPSGLSEAARTELNRVAARALSLADRGAVLLVQRRLSEDSSAYMAIKASGPQRWSI